MRTKLILFLIAFAILIGGTPNSTAQESGFKQPPVAVTTGVLMQKHDRPAMGMALQFNLPTITRETDYTLTSEASVLYSGRASQSELSDDQNDLYALRLTETARKYIGGTHGYVGFSVGGWIMFENGKEDTKPWAVGFEGGFAPVGFRVALGADMLILPGPDLFYPRITISRVGGL